MFGESSSNGNDVFPVQKGSLQRSPILGHWATHYSGCGSISEMRSMVWYIITCAYSDHTAYRTTLSQSLQLSVRDEQVH